MHLFNDGSPTKPDGQLIHVIADLPEFGFGGQEDPIGQLFIEQYTYDVVLSLLYRYLESRYQGLTDLVSLYAGLDEDMELGFYGEHEAMVQGIFDEAAMETQDLSGWAETLLNYFDKDSWEITQASIRMFKVIHRVIFFPVMEMIEVCYNAGLMLDPWDFEWLPTGICILMRISGGEYDNDLWSDSEYTHTPDRTGKLPVRTTAQIRSPYHGNGVIPVHPMVYTNTSYYR